MLKVWRPRAFILLNFQETAEEEQDRKDSKQDSGGSQSGKPAFLRTREGAIVTVHKPVSLPLL